MGQGGLAEVYSARDLQTGAEVALKVLHAHLAQEEAVAKRFRREMVVTRGLDAPSIVRVFDLHEHQGRPFLSMELLQGQTLAERLKQGPLPPGEAKRLALELCEALQAAHRRGVVHRDLKPQNIFVTENGHCKILDFGLARVSGISQLTGKSAVMGTAGYMAPETLEGAGADPRSDLYALGAVIFEMLTGRRAFVANDPFRVLVQQREAVPSARALNPLVSEADDAVVKRALNADPEQRYQDAAQLGRALSGEEVPVPQPVPPALTAGEFEVVVHPRRTGWKRFATFAAFFSRRRHAVEAPLGVRVPREWALRAANGDAVAVSGCSKASADALAQLLRDAGAVVSVEPARRRRPLIEWLARHARPLALPVAGAIIGSLAGAITLGPSGWPSGSPGKIFLGGFLATYLLVIFFAAWSAFSVGAGPLVADLPEGDPALLRLAQAVRRRAGRLEERVQAMPPAQRLLSADLLTAGKDVATAAEKLLARARRLDVNDAAQSEQREAAIVRLTEMGASLDDALAQIEAATGDDASAAQAMQRLREELDFVQRALPEVSPEKLDDRPALPPSADDVATSPRGIRAGTR